MTLGYTFVKRLLQQSGLLPTYRARGRHPRRREPRPCFGELLHLERIVNINALRRAVTPSQPPSP